MIITLGKNVEEGQKIKLGRKWRVIKEVTEEGAIIKEGLIKFGSPISAWKAS